MSYAPTRRDDPCIHCGDTTGKCRTHKTREMHLCVALANSKKGEKSQGYVIIGDDATGRWSQLLPDTGEEYSSEKIRELQLEWQCRERVAKQERLAGEMPATERDKHYRDILAQLSLSQEDKTDLVRRGFTDDQIARSNFKSVDKWQKLDKIYPGNLPGINSRGDGLITYAPGYVCPITNSDGLIVGLQVRKQVLAEGESDRYYFLSTNSNIRLHDQIPLAVFPSSSGRIALIEGVGAKPFLTRERLNVSVVGAAGANWASSKTHLERDLKKLGAKPGDEIIIVPDAGSVCNAGVANQYKRTSEVLQAIGYIPVFAWWGQYEKARNDIDEIQNFGIINYISPSEFFELANKSVSSIPNDSQPTQQPTQQINTDKSEESSQLDSQPEQQANDWMWDKWLRSRKFTPDVVINQAEFSFDGIDIPQSDAIIAVKSGLGTGKTNAEINETKKANINGLGTYNIGYRNNLLFQITERALASGVAMYHLHYDDEAHLMLLDRQSNVVFCIDSLKKVDGHIKGRDIHIDETCSVLLHAVNGGTLGNEQATILRIFKKALTESNRIFLYDANLADIHVDFVAKISAKKHVIKIENRQKIPPHNIVFVDGMNEDGEIKKCDRSPLVKFLLRPEVKPWVFADSKERIKVLYKLLTEAGEPGYALHSETTSEDWAKEFLADPNKFVLDKKPGFIALSPSAESGISSTVNGHFTHKISFFAGVLATNSQHQAMFRLRDNSIPHYVFCPEFSTIRDRSTPMTYSEKVLDEILKNRITQSLMLASESAENPQTAREIMMQALKRNDDDWWDFSLELAVLDNFEMNNYRKCLIHALREAGHNVTLEQWDTAISVKEAESEARVEIQKEHAKEVFAAVEFNSIEEANKKAKASPNKATQRRIEKTRLLDRLPDINLSEVWNDDFIYHCKIKNREFIRQQERYWLLKKYDVSQKRHESIWNHAALSEDFFSRQVSAMGHDVIWALRELKILDFTTRPMEYHKDSPEIVSLVNTLRDRKDIQQALRINQVEPKTGKGEERLRILSSLLNHIGYKTQHSGKKNVKTDRGIIEARHYRIVPIGTPPPASDTPAPTCDISCASALRELKILDFTTRSMRYHKDSPEVVSLVDTLRSRNDIQLALRITQVEPETDEGEERIRILSEVLKYAGYRRQYTKKIEIETGNGVIESNCYKVVPIPIPPASDTPPLNVNKPEGCVVSPQATHSDTPPLNVNKPGGCGASVELANSTPSSQFDLLAARQAILSCVEYKFTTWMQSDKSKVSWQIEEVAVSIQPEELTQNHVVEHATDEWLQPENLTETAKWLGDCENPEMLATVRAAVPAYVLKAASRLLPESKFIQIRQWASKLNNDAITSLENCESVEMLSELRAYCSDAVIEKACDSINPALKQWVKDWLGFWNLKEANGA